MDTDFLNIDYLKKGNAIQKKVYATLTAYQIMPKLSVFDPILVGTIPIEINIDNSDLDIICCFSDKTYFIKVLNDLFNKEKGFDIRENEFNIVANFYLDDFEIEIYGENKPTKEQNAYRHMLIECRLLNKKGQAFKEQIINLKENGYKTEPAFAELLGLEGDPYEALLRLDS